MIQFFVVFVCDFVRAMAGVAMWGRREAAWGLGRRTVIQWGECEAAWGLGWRTMGQWGISSRFKIGGRGSVSGSGIGIGGIYIACGGAEERFVIRRCGGWAQIVDGFYHVVIEGHEGLDC